MRYELAHDKTNTGSRILLPLGTGIATLAAICPLYSNNAFLAAAVAGIFLFTLLYHYSRFKLFLSLFAALVGAVGEIACCRAGLWIYANPSFHGLPLWLPIVWPIALMIFVEIAAGIQEVLETRTKNFSAVWIAGAAIIPIYALLLFFLINQKIAAILLVFAVFTSVFAHKPFNVFLFWIAALGGTIGEYVCVQFGVWQYTRPFFAGFGIPLSLPLTWGVTSNLIWLMAVGVCRTKK